LRKQSWGLGKRAYALATLGAGRKESLAELSRVGVSPARVGSNTRKAHRQHRAQQGATKCQAGFQYRPPRHAICEGKGKLIEPAFDFAGTTAPWAHRHGLLLPKSPLVRGLNGAIIPRGRSVVKKIFLLACSEILSHERLVIGASTQTVTGLSRGPNSGSDAGLMILNRA